MVLNGLESVDSIIVEIVNIVDQPDEPIYVEDRKNISNLFIIVYFSLQEKIYAIIFKSFENSMANE